MRFRKILAVRNLDEALFDEVTRQQKVKAIRVKTGTLVDATIIAAARERDSDACWGKHKERKAMHGFKVHVGADVDRALVEEIAIMTANVNDGKASPEAHPDNLAMCLPIAPIEGII